MLKKLPPGTKKTISTYSIFAFLSGIVLTLFFLNFANIWPTKEPLPRPAAYSIQRIEGYKFVKPVLGVEPVNESNKLMPVKANLVKLIDSLKQAGLADDVSVYLREFERGRWIAINPEMEYHPASLMKVALMLCYLRMASADPSMLKQKIMYEKPPSGVISPQFYLDKTIELGKSYTIHELLYYMIAYSDNNATWVLADRFDNNRLRQLFKEFGLPEPVEDELKFTLNVKNYSYFFKAIYNSSILSPEFSEYAAELLNNCSFKDGFAKGLPPNTEMWHKFGEWTNPGQPSELHESGVFYWHGVPYLLTVMTKGKDNRNLAKVIQAIAGRVYNEIPQP
jgi:beta-lactamase class A